MKYLANIVTAGRIIAALLLLRTEPLSPGFYALYLLGGVTDMVDGTIARKTGSAGEAGAMLDSVADLAFIAACLIKLLPAIRLPLWLWLWAGVIAFIRAVNLLSGCLCQGKPVLLHTAANRITGFLLFLLPLTLGLVDVRYPAVVASAVATFAAVQEGHWIRTGRTNRDS